MDGNEILQIHLTSEQAAVFSPLVLAAAAKRENAIFAVTVPEWSVEDGETRWHLQAIVAPARIGGKIRALILESAKPRAAAAKTPSVERVCKVMTAAGATKRAQNDPRVISRKLEPLRTGKLVKAMRATEEQQQLPYESSL